MALTDAEIGLADAITTLIEVFLAAGIDPSVIEEPLRLQRDTHLAAGREDASLVLEMIRSCVADPERARRRKILERFQKEPPEGMA